MTDLTEEVMQHVQDGLHILMVEFPRDEAGSAVEEINRGREARRRLREWNAKFTRVLEEIDSKEQVLRIMPYTGPGKEQGQPAYDVDGMQMLVEVIDNMSDRQFEITANRALNWTMDKPHLERVRSKTKKFYSALKVVRSGAVQKPTPEEQ